MVSRGGKFIEKGGKRSAWNNYVSVLFRNKLIKNFKDAGKAWQQEKTIDIINTVNDIVNKFGKNKIEILNDYLVKTNTSNKRIEEIINIYKESEKTANEYFKKKKEVEQVKSKKVLPDIEASVNNLEKSELLELFEQITTQTKKLGMNFKLTGIGKDDVNKLRKMLINMYNNEMNISPVWKVLINGITKDVVNKYLEGKTQPTNKIEPIKGEITRPIEEINEYLFNHKRNSKTKYLQMLYGLQNGLNFYPTPVDTCNKIYNAVMKNDETPKILDIGAGIGSLSYPFIKSGNYKSINMVEISHELGEILKPFEQMRDIKVINKDIFTIPSNSELLDCDYIIMNPPFNGNEYLRFILKACDILECFKITGRNYLKDIFVICPNSAFNGHNFVFPKKMISDIMKDNNIINKEIFEDGDAYLQVSDLGEVKGFKKLGKNGIPTDLPTKGIHLFNFMV